MKKIWGVRGKSKRRSTKRWQHGREWRLYINNNVFPRKFYTVELNITTNNRSFVPVRNHRETWRSRRWKDRYVHQEDGHFKFSRSSKLKPAWVLITFYFITES